MSTQYDRYFKTEELVLAAFRAEQLVAWKKGDKSIATPHFVVGLIVRNQPAYHFAETLALRHYYDKYGWQGSSPTPWARSTRTRSGAAGAAKSPRRDHSLPETTGASPIRPVGHAEDVPGRR
ncbi:MAG: hypothetical protein MZW92_48745 [Comamonadaceae bacterium]|nr:hypothetical protein [Comamonadaceae bacterium]